MGSKHKEDRCEKMKKRFWGIFLAAVLFASMSLCSISAAAETNISITRWNATTTTFAATLSGEMPGTVTVSLAGETITPTVQTVGGKTSITANLTTKLALDTWYTAEITADGSTVCMKEFQLKKLLDDNFDSYDSNAAMRAVWKASNENTAAEPVDGKMRVRNVWDEGTVYHKDLETEQKNWQDYTLEFEYTPGVQMTLNNAEYQPAPQMFAYMEAHPASVEAEALKFNQLRPKTTSHIFVTAAGMYHYIEGADETLVTNTKKVTDAATIQMSTKDGYVTTSVDGQVFFDKAIPAGTVRGGGIAFTCRRNDGINRNFFIDNLKVYKAVEKSGVLGYARNVAFTEENGGMAVSGTLEVLNQTESAKTVTVIAALYNADNRMNALRVLEFGTAAAGSSTARNFSLTTAGTDTNKLCLYLLDDLTGLTLYGEPITVLK